ncbi:MAG TPA: helicase C-terminal domain-containing protein, partial [Alphaproteobacteria bacterium]|nr:helicase C-terminal domain-containing protein [Alphaproteobacteria bacterium]
ASQFLMNPKEVSVAPPATTAAGVVQKVLRVPAMKKREALRALLKKEQLKNAFIFCNRKRDIGTLAESLTRHGFSVVALHGDLVQSKRDEALEKFRAGTVPFMVCSDVAARGLDIKGVDAVFNFDVPFNAEDYVHRIGRTGRAGSEGKAYTFVSGDDEKLLQSIQALIRQEIPEITLDGIAAEQPGEAEEQPRQRGGRDRQRGGRNNNQRREPREQAPSRARQEARHESKESRRESGDSKVVGFGDDLPNFLTRSRVASQPAKEDTF